VFLGRDLPFWIFYFIQKMKKKGVRALIIIYTGTRNMSIERNKSLMWMETPSGGVDPPSIEVLEQIWEVSWHWPD